MANFDLESYASVQDRIAEFVKDFPEGSVRTRMTKDEGPEVTFEARVYRHPSDVRAGVYTSGWAREVEGKSPVNRTSHVENCETSAIGRALANMGYATNNQRPSRSEMLKVQQARQDHDALLEYVRSIGAACEDGAEFRIAGANHNAKQYIRDNWQAMKEQPRVCRIVADALEVATGQKFAP